MSVSSHVTRNEYSFSRSWNTCDSLNSSDVNTRIHKKYLDSKQV